MDALRKIETESPYKDDFTFQVISMGSPEGKAASEKYDWQKQGHGLVVLDADGTQRALLPGHNYGRAEILAALDKLRKP